MKSCISVFRSRNNLTFKTVVFIVLTILPSYGFKAEAQPIPIGNVNDLQKIGNDPNYPLNGSYILIDDIDATGTNQWNSGQGFQPIGSQTNPFSGEFDGNGKKIIGLYINRTAQNVGLFSVTSSTAKIKNLTMATSSVASPGFGGVNLGAIVGTNNGLIENCHVISSSINATIGVGGICGANNATGILRRCVSSAYVSATLSSAGGLVGGNSGTIEESSSSGNVSAINSRAGGLVGSQSGGIIRSCFSTSTVSSGENVGGLVGELSNSLIENSYAVDGQVSGTKSIGGLVGKATHSAPNAVVVKDCYTVNNVKGKENVGGLVGLNNNSKIEYSYSKSTITIISPPGTGIGGLCGRNEQGILSYCFANAAITGTGSRVGGLVGYNYQNNSMVERCYSSSSINISGDDIGGFVGRNESGVIKECFSFEQSVIGSNNIGGLLGNNMGSVFDSYSWSQVSGNQYVGGFLGYNSGVSSQIRRCYSIGQVNGVSNAGGFSGFDSNNTITDSFWNLETSGQGTSWGGIGKSDSEMKQQSTYINWDFSNIWSITETQSYPYLRWQNNIVPNLLGLSIEQANVILTSIGLDLGEVVEECSDLMPIQGQVMHQSLEPGLIFRAGAEVDIKISSGRCTPFVAILNLPNEIIKRRGESLEIKVTVQGNIGNVTYQWYFEPLPNIKSGSPILGETDDTLFIQTLGYEHTGNYWCEVSDQYDTILSPPVKVIVESEVSAFSIMGFFALSVSLCLISVRAICKTREQYIIKR